MQPIIKKQGIFATPESMDALVSYIQQFPKEDQGALFTVAGMTWNLAAQAVEESLAVASEEVKQGVEDYKTASHGE